jgi:hypothetical protein
MQLQEATGNPMDLRELGGGSQRWQTTNYANVGFVPKILDSVALT